MQNARNATSIRTVDRTGTQLDKVDRAIIEALQQDGRVPYTKVGAAVGLSEAAARQRVQRLIDAGVMQVVAVTNPLSHGRRRMAMIGIRTEGATDRLAEVVVADDRHLLEVTNRIRSVQGVTSTETFIYLDLVKQTFTWGAH